MAEKNLWSVVVYDRPEADRMTVFDQHVAGLPAIIANGTFVAGGQINDDSDARKPIGSSLFLKADTREDVIEILKNDTFGKHNIWDIDNAIIHHLFCVYREGQEYQL